MKEDANGKRSVKGNGENLDGEHFPFFLHRNPMEDSGSGKSQVFLSP